MNVSGALPRRRTRRITLRGPNGSAALQLDVWMTLARAAERTRRIGLATGVIIPSLRRPRSSSPGIGVRTCLLP